MTVEDFVNELLEDEHRINRRIAIRELRLRKREKARRERDAWHQARPERERNMLRLRVRSFR